MSAKNFQQLILQDNCTDIKNIFVCVFNLIRLYVCVNVNLIMCMRFFVMFISFSNFVFFLQIIFFLVHPFNTILGSAKTRYFVIVFKIEFIVITKLFAASNPTIGKNYDM